jgi:hypothetical protein
LELEETYISEARGAFSCQKLENDSLKLMELLLGRTVPETGELVLELAAPEATYISYKINNV